MKIVVDTREPDYVISMLWALGIDVDRRMVSIGDYILSSEYAVERKTTEDFINSIFSGRLFEQAQALRDAYRKPMLILEGDIGLELEQRRNPRAFFGAMLRLELETGIPIIPSPSPLHTVDVLYTLAKRLERRKIQRIPIHHKPRLMSERDQQIYVVSSLPGIGDELARRLLSQFRTVRKILQAGTTDLEKVEGIGRVRAKRLGKLLDLRYANNQPSSHYD